MQNTNKRVLLLVLENTYFYKVLNSISFINYIDWNFKLVQNYENDIGVNIVMYIWFWLHTLEVRFFPAFNTSAPHSV